MNKYVSSCVKALEKMLNDNLQNVEVVVIESEIGMGKTTLVESFFETKNESDVFFFKSGISHITLDNIYQQLLSHDSIDKYDERITNLSFATFVLQNLIEYALSKVKYICFDGFGLYNSEAANFFFDFITGIINKQNEKKKTLWFSY